MSKKYKQADLALGGAVRNKKPLGQRIWNSRGYYLMFLPVFVFVIIMYYWPMLGVRYSFYSYKLKNIHWVGIENFQIMFAKAEFWSALKNTLIISIAKLLINTFAAVIISVFLNEMGNIIAKKAFQTVIYLPHFMSYAVVAAIFTLFLSNSSTGFINETLKEWGVISTSIDFLHSTKMWRPIFYLINMWKETGWGTVIFLATLAGINPEIYEAADIDGATRLQKIWYVTVPELANTIIIVLILNIAKVLNIFEPVFVLYNSRVYDVADVISTYIYRQTFLQFIPDYGYTTAVGLFKSVVGGILMLLSNFASKKVRGRGII
ncbi:putative aldouronate transport system permease protein [Butyrivibrio fibrisolvens DSM 3071]|uniref:Putative aldouronate transport system permease protein n=1 Tax=Butyrivibrio fibrisolvens DSM 3071 TaxID=1121131 RepID=A0A1M5UV55_BUTFI|nr:ABC transporter permease subunit [Butyrivibrio fibrisolvens]SHH66738.1 putative aldouronate transport system permease protein [Butyrivibrio fibrisolvens DSM 3071]